MSTTNVMFEVPMINDTKLAKALKLNLYNFL